jgi:hypothetical protein
MGVDSAMTVIFSRLKLATISVDRCILLNKIVSETSVARPTEKVY